ncbi:hypothetical protein [Apibacter mensalis]|jgi:hypothetical protein|uniref:hypothetical protein n=1 Tax=Apibacter mensalis TaxID=1586267 RepID=UPI000ABC6AEB|nr:hypothetical protein [Apibacter mensalis]
MREETVHIEIKIQETTLQDWLVLRSVFEQKYDIEYCNTIASDFTTVIQELI